MLFSCFSTLCILWNFGFSLGLSLGIQLISGLLLSCRYSSYYPYEIIDLSIRDVNNFWIISSIHSIGTTMYFIFMYIHMIRSVISSGSGGIIILSGVVLFIFSVLVAFLGYTLCYGNMAVWALTVVTSLIQFFPKGDIILTIILGNHSISSIIIPRALTIHFIGGIILWILTVVHLIEVHKVESTSDINMRSINSGQPFITSGLLKDLLMIIISYYFITINLEDETIIKLMMDDPHAQDSPELFKTPDPIGPEWYILSLYCGLKLQPLLSLMLNALAWIISLVKYRGKDSVQLSCYASLGSSALDAHNIMNSTLSDAISLMTIAIKNLTNQSISDKK